MPAITTTISDPYYTFLDEYAKAQRKPRNFVLEQGLELLKKQTMEEAVKSGFAERTDEYRAINEEFHDTQIVSIAS